MKYVLIAVIGYLLGSVSSGIIMARLFGHMDIRKQGSGNVGMTNVMRTLGWLPSVLTFVGDAFKGVMAALAGKWIGGEPGLVIGGLLAIAGHNWPVYYKFKGGKGMSTSFGFLLVADWRIAIILLVLQTAIVFSTGYMSVASLSSAIALAALAFILDAGNGWLIVACLICSALAVYSHRSNIVRLIQGKENRLSLRKINEASQKTNQMIKDRRNKP